VSEKDVKDASAGVLKDLKRFQGQKEGDLKRYMVMIPIAEIQLTG
jgi:sorting nexin-41/42